MPKIEKDHYITSAGKHILLSEMPFPHLMNAWNKAKVNHDEETAMRLEEEIQKRPSRDE